MFLSETKLVIRYGLLDMEEWLSLVRKSFSNSFERIGSRLMGL